MRSCKGKISPKTYAFQFYEIVKQFTPNNLFSVAVCRGVKIWFGTNMAGTTTMVPGGCIWQPHRTIVVIYHVWVWMINYHHMHILHTTAHMSSFDGYRILCPVVQKLLLVVFFLVKSNLKICPNWNFYFLLVTQKRSH